jgi:transcriptional regulator with XRE-family HTH domain
LKKTPEHRERLNIQLAAKLEYLHDKTGCTDKEVSAAIQVFITTYKRYRQGKQYPSYKNLTALSALFKVPLDFLVGNGIYRVWEQVLFIISEMLNSPSTDAPDRELLQQQSELELIHFFYSREGLTYGQESTAEEISAYIRIMLDKKK